MRYFWQWISKHVEDVTEITADIIRSYINYLRTERIPYAEDEHRKRTRKGLSVHTINIRIRALSTFFRFLFTENMIPNNRMQNISQVRHDAYEEVPGIPDKQIDAILGTFDDRQFAQWRDKTLRLLLLDTELRIGEALSLTADQVNFKELSITAHLRSQRIESHVKYRLVVRLRKDFVNYWMKRSNISEKVVSYL
jgi:integrase/recombinase XerD